MPYICPSPLKIGSTIGLVAPSSPLLPGRLEAGVAYLQDKGFKVKLGAHLHDADRFLAGRDQDRAEDIMHFFVDRDVKAIVATGGGYGAQRLLPYLDYELIRANPKWVTGFSDTTALHLSLLKKSDLITCSGFVFGDLDSSNLALSIEQSLMACLADKAFQITQGQCVHSGIAKGPLIGGNLETFMALMGTPYQPDFNGCVLLLEDVNAEPFQVDSRLSQLDLAGVFAQVSGVVFGQFSRCIAKFYPERDGAIDDVINEWSSRLLVPCLKEFPYGHTEERYVLPIGKEVQLNADKCTLTIL
ncbi:S66 peptidase family protein [Legionella fallonii]|uniref:Muramoyltetrapeptide carboxypeptidase n=1 Tax=Legionella fallonii LLAP-10 TaxID=1212491 RepID=A0A098G5D8_9GAMM|nr:LD-carboxypeptidase [Legionella fallonii]CEG57196.1 Muramoyltetrapeptide carboxypeptidase [Legionella fallonii LLAP-10]